MKKENKELLSRREFFRKAAKKTLPFVATLTLPSFLISCGGDDPIENGSGCDNCASTCQGGCQGGCSGGCGDSCKNTNAGSSSCSDCSAACKNDCEGTCSENCREDCNSSCNNTSTNNSGNGDKYVAVDLGLGVMWASFNVGATKEEEYGGYYGWADPTGEKTSNDLSDYPSENPPTNICGTQYDIAYMQWGEGWRLPSQNEMKELLNNCSWAPVIVNGVKGQKVTGRTGKSIFLPCGGYRFDGKMYYVGEAGDYWTGTLDNEVRYDIHGNRVKPQSAYVLNFGFTNNKGTVNNSLLRSAATLVRPVREGGSGCKDCASGCSSGCANSCDRDCTANCASNCYESCGKDCTKGCTDECVGQCQNGCRKACDNECVWLCTGFSG